MYNVTSIAETEKIASDFAKTLKAGDTVALFGDLGAGKTHFASAVARALGFTGETSSPTFSIVNEYIGGILPVYHFDMYRISTWDDLYTTNYDEYLAREDGIVIIEWAENIISALPEKYHEVKITSAGETSRVIEIKVNG